MADYLLNGFEINITETAREVWKEIQNGGKQRLLEGSIEEKDLQHERIIIAKSLLQKEPWNNITEADKQGLRKIFYQEFSYSDEDYDEFAFMQHKMFQYGWFDAIVEKLPKILSDIVTYVFVVLLFLLPTLFYSLPGLAYYFAQRLFIVLIWAYPAIPFIVWVANYRYTLSAIRSRKWRKYNFLLSLFIQVGYSSRKEPDLLDLPITFLWLGITICLAHFTYRKSIEKEWSIYTKRVVEAIS